MVKALRPWEEDEGPNPSRRATGRRMKKIKKKNGEQKKKLNPVRILIEESHYCPGKYHDEDDEWYQDDLAYESNIYGYELLDEDSYGDFYLDAAPKMGDSFFLVYVRYSTGDSYHQETGRTALVALLEKEEDAVFLAEDVRSNTGEDFKPRKILLPSGRELEYYQGQWRGYFERIEEVIHQQISRIK